MMQLFSISCFQSPQQFIAIYTGIFHQHLSPLNLTHLVSRTKSPPLSLIYTLQLLLSPNQHHLSLTILRFISQLADMSSGTSISSSLHPLLTETRFLTEVRHSITHKSLAPNTLLQTASTLILNDLRDKYWTPLHSQIMRVYCIDTQAYHHHYLQIFGEQAPLLSIKHTLDIQSCSQYEFKEHILQYCQSHSLEHIYHVYDTVDERKKEIMLISLLYAIMNNAQDSTAFLIITHILRNNGSVLVTESVKKALLKVYFLRKIQPYNDIVNMMDKDMKKNMEMYWKERV